MNIANAMFFTSSFSDTLPIMPMKIATIRVPAMPPSDSFLTLILPTAKPRARQRNSAISGLASRVCLIQCMTDYFFPALVAGLAAGARRAAGTTDLAGWPARASAGLAVRAFTAPVLAVLVLAVLVLAVLVLAVLVLAVLAFAALVLVVRPLAVLAVPVRLASNSTLYS